MEPTIQEHVMTLFELKEQHHSFHQELVQLSGNEATVVWGGFMALNYILLSMMKVAF